MARTSGFALVKGSKVEVLVGLQLREAMAKQTSANRYSPLERTKLHRCTFEYLGAGSVGSVKIGKEI